MPTRACQTKTLIQRLEYQPGCYACADKHFVQGEAKSNTLKQYLMLELMVSQKHNAMAYEYHALSYRSILSNISQSHRAELAYMYMGISGPK